MLLLQYSRQLAYLQCKLANVVQSEHCDCESIMQTDDHQDNNNLHDLPGSVSKLNMPDELFTATSQLNEHADLLSMPQPPAEYLQAFTAQCFAKERLRPPRSVFHS